MGGAGYIENRLFLHLDRVAHICFQHCLVEGIDRIFCDALHCKFNPEFGLPIGPRHR